MEKLYIEFRQSIGKLIDDATNPKNKGQILNVDHVVISTSRILEHGFITNKTMFYKGRTVWDFIQQTLNSPDIITTVVALTEEAAGERLHTYIQMALMQQTLGINMQCLYGDDDLLKDWYSSDAMLRNADMQSAVLGLLLGLNKLELNLYIKEKKLSKMPSITQFGTAIFQNPALKFGFQTTLDTIGKVQNQVIESAQGAAHGVNHYLSRTSMQDPKVHELETAMTVLHEKHEQLQHQLNKEHSQKLALEVELITLKMQKEKDVRRAYQEILRLEEILRQHQVHFESRSGELFSDKSEPSLDGTMNLKDS